ncbi:MAG: hypothetical protein MSH60_05030 [Ruminococcus sp.]|nr:hypothetical protein [Ruminococcus sp.]
MDLQQAMNDARNAEDGQPKMRALQTAYAIADNEKNLPMSLHIRYMYINESIFSGDRLGALLIFPEFLAMYDAHPELDDPRIDEDVSYAFRWVIEAAGEFYQVSVSQADSWFSEYARRLDEQGISRKIVYMKSSLYYRWIDRKRALSDFKLFMKSPEDGNSDGLALNTDHIVLMKLYQGDEAGALKTAKPIFEGKLPNFNLPHQTMADFADFYLAFGEYDKALDMADKLYPTTKGDPFFLKSSSIAIEAVTEYDLKRAAEMFSTEYPIFEKSKNPFLRYYFASAAAKLFDRMSPKGNLPKGLDGSFYGIAKDLADKFDARNGTSYFNDRLNGRTEDYYV